MFELATCENDGCKNVAHDMKQGRFQCLSCIDNKYGAIRTYVCASCGAEADAMKDAQVYCYNTVWHGTKGGKRMEMKE